MIGLRLSSAVEKKKTEKEKQYSNSVEIVLFLLRKISKNKSILVFIKYFFFSFPLNADRYDSGMNQCGN